MKLWGGRFKGEADAEFARFNASFSFDRRLIEADIEASLAHAEALSDAGVLDGEKLARLSGLKEIFAARAKRQATSTAATPKTFTASSRRSLSMP